MTPEQQIVYLASWRHASLCATPTMRGPGRPPEHSWTACPKMARFHWAWDVVDAPTPRPAPRRRTRSRR